jgi:hypothetical protein
MQALSGEVGSAPSFQLGGDDRSGTRIRDRREKLGRATADDLDFATVYFTVQTIHRQSFAFLDRLRAECALAAGRIDDKPLAAEDADLSEFPRNHGGMGGACSFGRNECRRLGQRTDIAGLRILANEDDRPSSLPDGGHPLRIENRGSDRDARACRGAARERHAVGRRLQAGVLDRIEINRIDPGERFILRDETLLGQIVGDPQRGERFVCRRAIATETACHPRR